MSIGSKMEDPPGTPAQSSHGHAATGGGTTPFDQANLVAFIGRGVEFKGVIKYQGSVQVDGMLEGEVHADGTLYLGEQAVISAKISAQSVISKGHIIGNINARERVQFLSPAVLDGAVKTPSLIMEEGVRFNGTCEMNPNAVKEPQPGEALPLVSVSEGLSPN